MIHNEAMGLKIGDRVAIRTKDFVGEGIVCVNETAKGKSTLVVEINDGYLIICPYQIEEQIG